ncbi:MAG: trypsin-like serine protease [Ruminococcaceae bacterium]|nr:trypsin-like serine protease [Oscillospiraceae bacterium]
MFNENDFNNNEQENKPVEEGTPKENTAPYNSENTVAASEPSSKDSNEPSISSDGNGNESPKPAYNQVPGYTANPYAINRHDGNGQQQQQYQYQPQPPKAPQGSYGYSYDYSAKPQTPPKRNNGILIFLGVIGIFVVSVVAIMGFLSGAGLFTDTALPPISSTPTETVTTDAPNTETSTVIPDGTETTPSKTDEIFVYGDNDGWINSGNITSDDAYINATYRTIDSVVAITTETASYNAFYGNYVSTGAGSGVIFAEEEDGNGKKTATYIITNNHVVSGATKIKVTLTNGDTHQATLIGTDAQTDIAVIKISAVGLKLASLGDSSKILLSQPVIAIGNPLGELANTVTDGRISGLERSVTIDGVAMSLIQTNAAVNPGNSGGGLFSLDGDLIGIVNAKSSGDSIEGIGFAIPINTAKEVAEDIITYGYVSGRPSIGIYGSIVTKDNYSYYKDSDVYDFIYEYYYANNNSILEGFYIDNDDLVKYGKDSEKFKKGDVVAEINGTKVQTSADITNALSSYEIGETITVSVYRLVQTTGAFGREKTEIRSFDISIVIVEKTS